MSFYVFVLRINYIAWSKRDQSMQVTMKCMYSTQPKVISSNIKPQTSKDFDTGSYVNRGEWIDGVAIFSNSPINFSRYLGPYEKMLQTEESKEVRNSERKYC